MRFLFFYAHPDDESAGNGAAIAALTHAGHEVLVVSATDGSAGEIRPECLEKVRTIGSLGAWRRHEFSQACEILGCQGKVLNFHDGNITNIQVWGQLKEAMISEIVAYKPDVVVTFDHSGWYFHLDHVGVSIAATLAIQQSTHRPAAFLLSYIKIRSQKWKYVYNEHFPITHTIDVRPFVQQKLAAIEAHACQDLEGSKRHLLEHPEDPELFQLVWAHTPEVQSFFEQGSVFTPRNAASDR